MSMALCFNRLVNWFTLVNLRYYLSESYVATLSYYLSDPWVQKSKVNLATLFVSFLYSTKLPILVSKQVYKVIL